MREECGYNDLRKRKRNLAMSTEETLAYDEEAKGNCYARVIRMAEHVERFVDGGTYEDIPLKHGLSLTSVTNMRREK